MKLSLILATYGRAAEIERLFDSLAQQSCRDFEVLVVDQNQDERLEPFIARAASRGLCLRHLRLGQPSLSGARNLGLANARHDIVAFPDDDCWYEHDTVAKVVQHFEADPALDGVVARWVEQSQARPEIDDLHRLRLAEWRSFRGGDASSISLFLKRSRLLASGGFDERLGVGQWYGAAEETDLLLRLLEADAKLVHAPAVKVRHAFVAPSARPPASKLATLRRARGTGALYAKHRLPAWTVVRGILAPPLKALVRAQPATLAAACAVSLGRLQGLLRWHLEQRRRAR